MPFATAYAQREESLLTVEQLPDAVGDTRGELVRGRFIPMAPTGEPHAETEASIVAALHGFVRGRGLGKVLCGEIGIVTQRGPDTVRGADVAFISAARLAQRSSSGGYLQIAPELVVEVISPNDRWSDVTEKVEEYFAAGVESVWLVDPKRRQVSVYRSPTDIEIRTVEDSLDGGTILPGFRVAIAELFER